MEGALPGIKSVFVPRLSFFRGRAFKYSSGVFASSCLLVTRRVFQRRLSQRHSSPITAIIARFPPPILASSLLNALSSRFQRRRLDITHDVIILEHINSKYFVSIYIIATSFSEISNVDSFFTKLRILLYIYMEYLNGTIIIFRWVIMYTDYIRIKFLI